MDQNSVIENLPEPVLVERIDREPRAGRAYSTRFLDLLENMLRRFSPFERLLLYGFSILLGLCTVVLLIQLNTAISVEVPARGGSFIEGETGPARFINPVLAVSGADQDLSQLVYSGLMRALPDGTYIPDLAEKYTISEDGTTYTFTLRKNARFSDGVQLTAADVLYTIAQAQNPDIKSPHRADWEGVSVTSPDPQTVIFTLPHAYAPFIEDTALGILPKHLWQSVQPDSFPYSELNTKPIGSGPYKIANVRRDATGAPTRYDLVPFADFTLGSAYISRLSFVFYPNQDALIKAFKARQIDSIAGVSPSQLSALKRDDASAIVTPLPRVFGIFFNQNHNASLSESAVRQALETSIDKKQIVDSVLHGFGEALESPIPPGILGERTTAKAEPLNSLDIATSSSSTTSIEDARAILQKSGWALSSSTLLWQKKAAKNSASPDGMQTLSLKLATADEPELVATANLVASQWRALGVSVDVQIYPLSDFNNTVLRPRNYDAILFGEVVSRSGDLFAFWHSSQRNDPGLNLALYANAKADSLLSKARASSDKNERDDLSKQFEEIVRKDMPAIFLYSPDFIYIVPSRIRGIQIGALSGNSERFLNAYQWYSDTERVWNFFASKGTSL